MADAVVAAAPVVEVGLDLVAVALPRRALVEVGLAGRVVARARPAGPVPRRVVAHRVLGGHDQRRRLGVLDRLGSRMTRVSPDIRRAKLIALSWRLVDQLASRPGRHSWCCRLANAGVLCSPRQPAPAVGLLDRRLAARVDGCGRARGDGAGDAARSGRWVGGGRGLVLCVRPASPAGVGSRRSAGRAPLRSGRARARARDRARQQRQGEECGERAAYAHGLAYRAWGWRERTPRGPARRPSRRRRPQGPNWGSNSRRYFAYLVSASAVLGHGSDVLGKEGHHEAWPRTPRSRGRLRPAAPARRLLRRRSPRRRCPIRRPRRPRRTRRRRGRSSPRCRRRRRGMGWRPQRRSSRTTSQRRLRAGNRDTETIGELGLEGALHSLSQGRRRDHRPHPQAGRHHHRRRPHGREQPRSRATRRVTTRASIYYLSSRVSRTDQASQVRRTWRRVPRRMPGPAERPLPECWLAMAGIASGA